MRWTERTVRKLIEDVATNTPQIGTIEETTKWGQPSFATAKANIG